MGAIRDVAEMIDDAAATMESRLNARTFLEELGAGVDKMFSQGAAELGQALFSGNAYMPYGPTQSPIAMAEEAPANDTAPAQVSEAPVQEAFVAEPPQSYEQMLDSYTPPTPPEQQQENAMER